MRIHNGCEYDILFNSQKSQLMIFDTMRLGYNGNIMLGEAPLTVTKSYKYLGLLLQMIYLMNRPGRQGKGSVQEM